MDRQRIGTVTYDDRAGRGVEVDVWRSGPHIFLDLTFRSVSSESAHTLTPLQVAQLQEIIESATAIRTSA